MKLLTNVGKLGKQEMSATKTSIQLLLRGVQNVYSVSYSVLSKPANTLYGMSAAFLSVLLAFWFANISIIQSVLSSNSLETSAKLEFILSINVTLFRNLAMLQIVLILIHIILWSFVGAFWFEAVKIQHERIQLREKFAPVIFSTLIAGTIAIIGISLFTPVLTRIGISVFVSDHFSGTVLVLCALFAEIYLIKKFTQLLSKANEPY